MDINVLRSIATVTSFVFFVGVLVWAFSRRNSAGFDEAARLPFIDENAQQRAQEQS